METTQQSAAETAITTSTSSAIGHQCNDKLVFTGNSLADIIGWLKMGFTVIIYSGDEGLFYRMPGTKAIRKIYVDVSKLPSLLHEGEWPWYIKNAGAKEIEDCDSESYEISESIFIRF